MNLDFILNPLKVHAGVIEVIYADQKGKKPKYPYVTLKITSETGENGPGIVIQREVPSQDPQFEVDIEQVRIEMPEVAISVNVYASEPDQAWEVAKKCQQWFKFVGEQLLKENHVVLISTSSIQNRDVLLIVDFERRCGFDVMLRTVDEVSRKVASVDSTDIKKGE
ncbi:phage neck terminator protein [Anaerosolibacter sp.]|uniref:phage neck terminator protein n=1 Tax=Anaerosolibacter sp. TaxID=1872527 RepID=UPI0039F0536F